MTLPDDDTLRWIVSTYATLQAAHGDALDSPALVQPTGTFFPDEFRGDAPGVARMLARMIEYAPVADDLPLEIAFLVPETDHAGGCGSLACGTSGDGAGPRDVEETGTGYRLFVATGDVGSADVLATSLARSVGGIVLREAGEVDLGLQRSELAAVACGFGVLLANGAAVWAKACSGLRMARATALAVEEVTVALALFVAVHGLRASEARSHLGATQREAFDLAVDWLESNPAIAHGLAHDPALLATGAFEIHPVEGALGRWLQKRRHQRELPGPRAHGKALPEA